MRRIKAEALTAEAFAPFGKTLDTEGRPFAGEDGMYRWYDREASVEGAGAVSVNLMACLAREFVFSKFERHMRTTETMLPLTGPLVVAGIPAGEPSPDRVRAFIVPVGKGISWAPGVWHYAPFPLGADTMCTVVFRQETGSDDKEVRVLPEEMGFEL